MTWTRLDDHWTRREVFCDLGYETRWHYLALIEFCSVNRRYDGSLRRIEAFRCSDVEDTVTVMAELTTAGLVTEQGDRFVLPQINEHIPPPSMRDDERKERQRVEKRRSRLHARGDHSECLPASCLKAEVSPEPVSDESDGGSSPSRPVLSRPGVSD